MDTPVSASVVEPADPAPDSAQAAPSGRYLYAVVAAPHARRHDGSIGVAGGSVYPIAAGPLAAIVSDVPNETVRPRRQHLAAHQRVLGELMQDSTPLPMSFGIIAESSNAIRRILQEHQAELLAQLQRVKRKVEMGLKVRWDVSNIFEYFVDTHPRLRALRDQAFHGGREPSQAEKIELGRAFDQMLSRDRAAHTATVAAVLRAVCFEVKLSKPRDEREVMSLACLVGRDAQPDFEQTVFQAAELFDSNFSFDYSGPWPPYSFMDRDLGIAPGAG